MQISRGTGSWNWKYQRHSPNINAGVGVFNGCFYTDQLQSQHSVIYPGGIAASDITAFVIDDPVRILIDADELSELICTRTTLLQIQQV